MARVRALGAGLVGSFVVQVLAARGHHVDVYDLTFPEVFNNHPLITMHKGDAIAAASDFPSSEGAIPVINMLPGRIGAAVRPILVEKGLNIIDLAFTAEEPSQLDELASQSGSILLWDVGIAPGLSNMLLAEAQRRLGKLKEASIKVGGNPSQPDDGWSYMAPFSPADVIEEYTRPARVKRRGEVMELPPLCERHLLKVEGKGEMEAFLTDGLRSVLHTIEVEEMSEYTVRWPGHIDRFIELAKGGEIDESALLEEWAFQPERKEFTWLQVKALSKDSSLSWIVQDEGRGGESSMARTTGLVTAACVELILANSELLPAGVHPPEALPRQSVAWIVNWMRENGVRISGPDLNESF